MVGSNLLRRTGGRPITVPGSSMDLLLYSDEEEADKCRCGRGWCAMHGTFHFSKRWEDLELERRLECQKKGTSRGGCRVIRIKVKE